MIQLTVEQLLRQKKRVVMCPVITKLFFATLVALMITLPEGSFVSYAKHNTTAQLLYYTSQPGLNTHLMPVLSQGSVLSRGNPLLPEIALTFDDGPNPYYTLQVLSILKHFGIKATFFCIGRQVALFPWIVKREYSAGDIIGNHTWSHPLLPTLSALQIFSQIAMTSDILQKTIGVRPVFFRPPYGGLDADVLVQANRLKLVTTLWSDDPRDWSLPGTAEIIRRVLAVAGDGTIILMHDGGGNRAETVAALPIIIETLLRRGFHFVTLPRLLRDLQLNSGIHLKG